MTLVHEIQLIPPNMIDAPSEENLRSGAWENDPEDPSNDDGGYPGLKASMAELKVNTTPIVTRPHPDPNSKKPYLLVDGWRRHRAATELGLPYLRVIVEQLTDYQARLRNIQAGVGPARFKPADLAWGIADLKRLGGPKLTDDDMARQLGISKTYVTKLRRIMTEVDSKVTTTWRASSVKVGVDDMQRLTVLPREQHWKEWESLVLESQTRPSPRAKFSTALRLERQARELGRTVGALVRLGVLPTTPRTPTIDAIGEATDFRQALPLLTKTDLEPEAAKKLATVMNEGYQEGLSGKDPR